MICSLSRQAYLYTNGWQVRCTGFDESESGRCTNCQRLFQACVFTPKSTNREASAPLYALWKGRGSALERHAQHEMTNEAQSQMHVMRGHPPPDYTDRSHGHGHAHYQPTHRPEKSSYIDFGAPMHHQMQPSNHHHSAPQAWHPMDGDNNSSMRHHSPAEYRHRTPLEPLRQAQPVQRPDWSAYYGHDDYSQHRVRTPAGISPLPRSSGSRMDYGHQPHRLSVPSPHDYQNMWPQNNASVSPRSDGSTVQANHHNGMLPVMEPSYDTSTLRPTRTDIYPPPYERVKISDLVSVDEKNDGNLA